MNSELKKGTYIYLTRSHKLKLPIHVSSKYTTPGHIYIIMIIIIIIILN
jgi:hypothetical protein